MIRLRPFRAADIGSSEEHLSGLEYTGVTAVEGGRVVGYGFIYWLENRAIAVFHADSSIREQKTLIHRTVRRVLKAFDISAEPLLTYCDESIPRAREWLQRLGFRELDYTQDGHRLWVRGWKEA